MHKAKVISITAATLLASLSFSTTALALVPGHFVSGVELGYIVKAGNLVANHFQLFGSSIVDEQNEYINNHGTVYGAFAGYQIPCRNYIFGVEAYFDLGRYEQVANFPIPLLGGNTNTNLSYYRDFTYGVSARIGYKVSPCFVPYIRVGTQGGEDHFIVNYTGLFAVPTWDHFESKKVNWDYLVAAGLEVPLFSKKFTLRLEYDYLFAHELSYNDDVAPVEIHYSYSPHAHVVKLQWVWNFGCQ